MKPLTHNYTYLTTLKYLAFFVFCLIFNSFEPQIMPYSFSLFVTVVFNSLSVFVCGVLYLLCFIVQGAFEFLLSGAIQSLLVLVVFLER